MQKINLNIFETFYFFLRLALFKKDRPEDSAADVRTAALRQKFQSCTDSI
jgi:hypothetical protein